MEIDRSGLGQNPGQVVLARRRVIAGVREGRAGRFVSGCGHTSIVACVLRKQHLP